MSAFYQSLVWTESQAKGVHKLVLLALADHAGPHGEAQASLRDLASLCGLSKTRVEEIIAALVESGELQVRAGGTGRGNPTRYWIALRNLPADRPVRIVSDDRLDALRESAEFAADIAAPKAVVVASPVREEEKVTGHYQGDTTVDLKPGPPIGEIKPAPKSAGPTQADVDDVLAAAGITAPDTQPFYWSRREHREDLTALLKRTRLDISALCDRLRAAKADGRALEHQPRRLIEVEPMLKGGRG